MNNMDIAFDTYRVFTDLQNGRYGNTSPVIILPAMLTAAQMQQIAADFWQPATTFLWQENGHWNVRWFAPDQEIQLCGHGSMAAIAHLTSIGHSEITLRAPKHTISGGRLDGSCYVDLAAIHVIRELKAASYLEQGLGVPILGYFETGDKNIVLTDSEHSVERMKPDFSILRSSPTFGYAVTAPGEGVDFVSRTLVPHVHQLEDPATGSSHAALTPFWAARLRKEKMHSLQLSSRGGKFTCELHGQTVRLYGAHEKIASGTVHLVGG